MSTDPPRLSNLLETALPRAAWLRLIRRFAHSRSLSAARLLLRARFGPPQKTGIVEPAADKDDGDGFWFPARTPQEHYLAAHPEADVAPSPAGQDTIARLIDEALSPADWAALLHWLGRAKTPGALELLWNYRFGLRAAAQPEPRRRGSGIRYFDYDHPPPSWEQRDSHLPGADDADALNDD
jgi:hypothetical protein